MKQSALTTRHFLKRLSLIAFTFVCLSLSASPGANDPVKVAREGVGSSSLSSTQAAPQSRALLVRAVDTEAKSSAQRQSRVRRQWTQLTASAGNFNVSGHSLQRCCHPDNNASPFYASFALSGQQGRAPPRAA